MDAYTFNLICKMGVCQEALKRTLLKKKKKRHVNDKQPHVNDRPKEGKLLNLCYETNINHWGKRGGYSDKSQIPLDLWDHLDVTNELSKGSARYTSIKTIIQKYK